ncbi:MAG: hypothetical protein CL662_01135 [Bacteroidetes bacterium]|nr:hypothetical protein [Bacteroidota bacterium]|tara:strand:+ start:104 stop:328 length:225 start_codon:yes stop_codon:yes gene_type:complete
MLNIIGSKLMNHHGLGQKAKSVAKKVGKVAMGAGVGGVAVLGAIGAATGGLDPPVAKMVRSRGGLERAIRGGNR